MLVHCLIIFLNLVAFRHNETGQMSNFWTFSREDKGRMARNSEIWLVDVSISPAELIRFWSWSVDFPHCGAILTW